jgi:hypothetical protein
MQGLHASQSWWLTAGKSQARPAPRPRSCAQTLRSQIAAPLLARRAATPARRCRSGRASL